jgi:hypothetical protein
LVFHSRSSFPIVLLSKGPPDRGILRVLPGRRVPAGTNPGTDRREHSRCNEHMGLLFSGFELGPRVKTHTNHPGKTH